MVGAVGAGAVLLLVAGCGGGESKDKSSEQASAGKAAARPVALQTGAKQVTWTDDKKKAHQLRATPKSLLHGSVSDLSHVRLDDDLKGMEPYYLTVSFVNTGKGSLDRPGLEGKLSVIGADGRPGKGVMLINNPLATDPGMPEQCRKGDPAALAAGGTAEVCKLVMLAKGQQPMSVSYADDGGDTAVWPVGDGKSGGPAGVLKMGASGDTVVDDMHKHMVPVKLTPKSVRAGSLSDLSAFKLSDGDKNLVPYYVTIEYRNTGQYDLLPDLQDKVAVQSAGGQRIPKLTLLDIGGPGVDQCPDRTPDATRLKANGTITQCSIHMVPKGDRPTTFTYEGAENGAKPITWRAS